MINYNKYNNLILRIMSIYLNDFSKSVSENDIKEISKCGVSKEFAYSLYLESFFNIDDREFFNKYLLEMIHELDEKDYVNNPYYVNIKVSDIKIENWHFKNDYYEAYEAFVFNDMLTYLDGRVIPQIGYFCKRFKYPAIYENDRLWMSVTPNEIETMKEPINLATGNVLTFGLGLGYFCYMTSLKEDVKKVIVVEKDKDVIKLFKEYILPQFEFSNKIEIINDDAFNYIKNLNKTDINFVFTDIWHDVSDGKDLYLKMKEYEKDNPHTIFKYWIEKTIKCYL